VPAFTVQLQVLDAHGECIGATEDTFDAADAAEAEQLAIAAWKAARPSCSFAPLLTVERRQLGSGV
jgi:hypothetical protein